MYGERTNNDSPVLRESANGAFHHDSRGYRAPQVGGGYLTSQGSETLVTPMVVK